MGKSADDEMEKRARESLTKIDRETFEARVGNLVELMPFFAIDVKRKVSAPESPQNFWTEALTDYLNECFRSSIFSCASAVEQAFKERLIIDSDDPEETLWKFEIKKFTLGDIIKEAKKNKKLSKLVSTANEINKFRNEIAVHPIQTPLFPKPQDKRKTVLTNLSMIRAIRKVLTFLPNEYAGKIGNLNVGEDKKRTLKEVLDDPTVPEIRLAWHYLQKPTLRVFAYQTLIATHRIMVELYEKKEV